MEISPLSVTDIIERQRPEPWQEADHLPWDDPDFSERMLQEHLSQAHDAASRRSEIIDQHVLFIHEQILGSQPARVLDLCCGPGLYVQRLCRFGHRCLGIDFSPASIRYAVQTASTDGNSAFVQEDIRRADFGENYDLVMLLYGEFNVFPPQDARLILRKAAAALKPKGKLLLEPSPETHIRRLGTLNPTWYSSYAGLFSAMPHLVLNESFWDERQRAATQRYFVVESNGSVRRIAMSYQAYSDSQYRELLAECGFKDIEFLPSLTGGLEACEELFVILSERV
jgi:SAM-dependent methyltransferase